MTGISSMAIHLSCQISESQAREIQFAKESSGLSFGFLFLRAFEAIHFRQINQRKTAVRLAVCQLLTTRRNGDVVRLRDSEFSTIEQADHKWLESLSVVRL